MNNQRGSIIISTVIMVFLLTVLGVSLQLFLRNQLRSQYGLFGDKDGLYNLPVDDAHLQALHMAEYGLNWVIWHANHTSTNPGTGLLTYPVPGPTARPIIPVPAATPTPGYTDPDYHILPEPLFTPTPTPSIDTGTGVYPAQLYTFKKDFRIEAGSLPNELKVTGRAYIKKDTTDTSGTFQIVSRTVYAQWAQSGGVYYLKKSTYKLDQ